LKNIFEKNSVDNFFQRLIFSIFVDPETNSISKTH